MSSSAPAPAADTAPATHGATSTNTSTDSASAAAETSTAMVPAPLSSVLSPSSLASQLSSLVASSAEPLVFVESSDHTVLALPLTIARRCHAIITKHLHSDLTPHGTAMFTTITGEALVRCISYIQHEWKEIEKRKEKLALLMKSRGQKGSERVAAMGTEEKEGGGRRGKDREKNLLFSIEKATQSLIQYFQQQTSATTNRNTMTNVTSGDGGGGSQSTQLVPAQSQSHPQSLPSSAVPLFPPHAVGVTAPTHPIGHLLAPASSLAHNPTLAYAANHLLCELASSSYYLEIPPLVDLTCQRLADSIQGKSPEEIRTTFNITNDFTPVEEEQVKQRVMERTLLYPGSMDHYGTPLDSHEQQGFINGFNAGMGQNAAQRLKAKLQEKRLAQQKQELKEEKREDTATAHTHTPTHSDPSPQSQPLQTPISSAAKKKTKKKKKKKRSKEEEKENDNGDDGSDNDDNPLVAPASTNTNTVTSNPPAIRSLLQEMASTLTDQVFTTTAAAEAAAESSTAAFAAVLGPLTAEERQQQRIADREHQLALMANSAVRPASAPKLTEALLSSDQSPPKQPFAAYTDLLPLPSWYTLRLHFTVPVTPYGVYLLHCHMPAACMIYTGLTLGSTPASSSPIAATMQKPSPMVHVCFTSQSLMMDTMMAVREAIDSYLRCPPIWEVQMWEEWRTGRLMLACNDCGESGHQPDGPQCIVTMRRNGTVSLDSTLIHAHQSEPHQLGDDDSITYTKNPQSTLVTLRLLFRHSLDWSVIAPLSLLLPNAKFLHLGFHPFYKTPTHFVHATFANHEAMQKCLLNDLPSIVHFMHQPPRIELFDTQHTIILKACDQCGTEGKHASKNCPVKREGESLPKLDPSMLPPISFANITGSATGRLFDALEAVIASGNPPVDGASASASNGINGKRKRRHASISSDRPSRASYPTEDVIVDDDDNDDGDGDGDVNDHDLSVIIDAKLSGLQHYENANSTTNDCHNHGIEPLFPSSSLASFFCFCQPQTEGLPLPDSFIPDVDVCSFAPILSTMTLCVQCGLLQSTDDFSSELMTSDIQSLIAGTDPGVIASLPYPLSAMLNAAAYTNMPSGIPIHHATLNIINDIRAIIDRQSNVNDSASDLTITDESLLQGLQSIQLHQTKSLPQLLAGGKEKSRSPSPSPLSEASSPTTAATDNAVASRSHSPTSMASPIGKTSPQSEAHSQTPPHIDHSASVPCSACAELSARVRALEFSERRLLKQLEEINKRFDDKFKKLDKVEEKLKRLDKLETSQKSFASIDEKVKSLLLVDTSRREWERKYEKRLTDESKKRADFERWFEDATVERDEFKKSIHKKFDSLVNDEKAHREKRDDEDTKLKQEVKKLQQRLTDSDRELKALKDRRESANEQQQKKKELTALTDSLQQLTSRCGQLEQMQHSQQQWLHQWEERALGQSHSLAQSLINVSSKVDGLEQSLILSETNLSRSRIAEIIGFDFGDES